MAAPTEALTIDRVGNVITENGEYYKVMLVLENVTTSSITIRVVNVTSAAVPLLVRNGEFWQKVPSKKT